MNIKNLLDIKFLKDNKKALILFIVGLLGILLIFVSELGSKDKPAKKDNTNEISYKEELENELDSLISSIEGAGKTKVFLTIEENEEYVYAKDSSENYKDGTQNSTDNKYVIIDEGNRKNGLVLKIVNPKIRGVAVVCEGGDNVKVQQRIYSCISASLGVSTARISISKMTSTEVNNEK